MPNNKRKSSEEPSSSRQVKRRKFTLNEVPIAKDYKEGLVLATGAGDVGQLGLGSEVLEKTRFGLVNIDYKIIDVYAGGMHTVCLTQNGQVITFGCNDEGALGRSTTTTNSEFEPGLVDLPGKVKQITAGDSHTAALLEDGKAYVWGTFRDSHGSMGLTPSGSEKLPYLMMPDHVIIKIASGADHVVFLTNHGEVFTCGCAEQGQLGRIPARSSERDSRNSNTDQLAKFLVPRAISIKPSLKLHFEDIWAGHYATFAKVAGKNDVYVFGLNNYNQIGAKETVEYYPTVSNVFSKHNWQSICCGQHHTLGLDVEGNVFTIGRKEYGRLGLGEDCKESDDLVKIPLLEDNKVIYIGNGSATSFAVTEEGKLYGWGMGNNGQLGTGGEDDCYVPTLIRGNQLEGLKVYKVSGGGQHTVILALSNINNNKTE
ncbi:regulator of chromosome condensation-like [Onthophagus taurus]|uniref:regulator of chromosome condensation-like n=1 Tax=Onthophagus taurus TaxID=166361 RepID=UPI000C20625B|nr:regulator of chromosome condensation-like [Onthophagus taurus]